MPARYQYWEYRGAEDGVHRATVCFDDEDDPHQAHQCIAMVFGRSEDEALKRAIQVADAMNLMDEMFAEEGDDESKEEKPGR